MQLVGPLLMWTPLMQSKLSISGRRGNAFERYEGVFQSSPLLYSCVVYNLEIYHIVLTFSHVNVIATFAIIAYMPHPS